jgi:hypothetical protein
LIDLRHIAPIPRSLRGNSRLLNSAESKGVRNVSARPLRNYDNGTKYPIRRVADIKTKPLDRIPRAGWEEPAMQSGSVPSAWVRFSSP